MKSFISHEGTGIDVKERLALSDSWFFLSLDGIRGIGLASRLATTLHYKNPGSPSWVLFVKMNSLEFKIYCRTTDYLLQKTPQRASKAPIREDVMQALVRLLQEMGVRVTRQAWGLAADGQGWALVGVSHRESDMWRVQVSMLLTPPVALSVVDSSWLSQALTDVPHPKARARHRLAIGLHAQDVVTGQLICPVQVPQQAWPAEVQLEVAQALNLPPEDVNFDFESEARSADAGPHIRWVGCARSLVVNYQHWIGAAHGWRLTCVEPEIDAAQRAAQALVGGLPSLLQQAPQDWQFRLNPMLAQVSQDDTPLYEARESRLLQEALASPVGPRLVAAGLALKAWT